MTHFMRHAPAGTVRRKPTKLTELFSGYHASRALVNQVGGLSRRGQRRPKGRAQRERDEESTGSRKHWKPKYK
jgi:hypothetical protein